ncbi:chemotaxis protein CheV [Oceanisphaera psychrotolerans]|uniref:Chemotaxis protein CheW n=1 Tax=Oceanisphaera psychrotolerans TaxID=1414654 RepID=A0A1J4QF03_9GAMM|nr:chemotaxis protein CheV [Oceanisphaera psychrotolerans]OIN07734.1 chemotaxis protein CheW [Oceanisphaera psychrotolerans]
MAGILDSVNQRTQLVGQNRLELLLFKLNGRQRFGINVFKVKEVLQCPRLTALPQRNAMITGVANIRGQTISIIDLSKAMGGRPIAQTENSFAIISEYNRSVQGFLVNSVERIINVNWESILPPPRGAGRFNYMTAVTEIDGELVEILDVEKILDEISPVSTRVNADIVEQVAHLKSQTQKPILIADDSSVARRQIQKAMETLGLECIVAENGKLALNKLREMAAAGPIEQQLSMVISDVEMPEMDGYTLTAEIRNDSGLKDLHVILHTSLSGVFNKALVEKVGANNFIAKFNPDELASAVKSAL